MPIFCKNAKKNLQNGRGLGIIGGMKFSESKENVYDVEH